MINKKLIFSFKYIIIYFELFLLKHFIHLNNKISSISNNNLLKNNSLNFIKKKLQDIIFKKLKHNKNYSNILYIKGHVRFGNYFICLNNAIIFCEFLSCKKIIIESEFINHQIFYQKYNLTIESNYSFNKIEINPLIINIAFFFKFNFTYLGQINRFYVFREEIINNLPKVKINFDELYIYIRGGDIFKYFNKSPSKTYIQPPLCFYKSILNQFIFRKFVIISEDKANPVIKKLIKEYPYIKYNKNNIKLDISYLLNSYNIISATSSFIASIIKLNKNLKYLWEYDFYILLQRYLHLHYSVYSFSFNYTIINLYFSQIFVI